MNLDVFGVEERPHKFITQTTNAARYVVTNANYVTC